MTCTILHWIPIFTRPETVKVILDSLKYLQKDVGLRIYAFVILENHLHLIVQSNNVSKDMSRFKSYTARNIVDYLKLNNAKSILDQLSFYKKAHKQDREFQLWQEGIQPKQIQSIDMMKDRINYIHNNPVKRGYVDVPKHWRYSSARIYEGNQGLLDIEVADGF
ncbi:Transposase and inactivated derivatives [hydrothermal vent metagenome]|uniref:Transposase and inactivated derivatives n=1 Tax=hydrothermal vent metagenome TaxID=652676 RepID=A0A3B0VAN4_9ZZZZ